MTEKKTSQNKNDKFIQSILVCPAYPAEAVKEGVQLSKAGYTMECYNTKRWKVVIRNNNNRYHYLPKEQDLQIPELVIDFKHYYTISRELLYSLYKAHYVGSISELFRESLSQRFAHYLSRVALPNLNKALHPPF